MPQAWEYKRVQSPTDAQLAELGAQGWELVNFDTTGMFYFKRPAMPRIG
jgi:hypothetical protein